MSHWFEAQTLFYLQAVREAQKKHEHAAEKRHEELLKRIKKQKPMIVVVTFGHDEPINKP